MPSVYSISDFLHAFEGVYETLDVRAAVVRDKDKEQWLLMALSVHVRMASPETAKQEFLDTIKRFGAIDSPVFRIVQQCYPITEAQRFFQEIKNGNLKLENFRVWLSDSCDILTLAGSMRVDYHNPSAHWPRIEQQRQIVARDSNIRQLLLNNAEILCDTEMAGYENPHLAVNTLLDINISQSTEPGGVWIACDAPVRLLPPQVTRNGKEFKLKLRAEAHPAIEDVACTIRRTGGPYGSNALLQQSVIKLTRFAETKNPALWSGEIQLPVERDDQVTLEILSKKVGKLYHTNIRPFNLLPIEQNNPLMAALRLFCPPEEIGQLLQEPHRAKMELANLKNPGRLFEVSVQWLLSVLGFRAVWLHNYERLKDANMDYGTIDCLAYKEDEDLLLLVNCSLAAPNPSELNRHEDLMTRLSNQLFQDSKVKVRSALFTTAHKPEAEQQNARGSAIKMFFKEDIDQLLRVAEGGQILEYLRSISPLF